MKSTRITRGIAILLASAALLASRTGYGAPPVLSVMSDPTVLDAVRAAASQPSGNGVRLTDTVLFTDQSFRIISDNRDAGALVSGRGTLPAQAADANPVTACFLALARPAAAPRLVTLALAHPAVVPQLVITIGAGDWEAESCNGIVAIGLLPDADGRMRAALIYKTTAPHESPIEPVVVSWSATGPLTIDAEASKRASSAGAETVQQVRASLK